jgi:ABC-type dipeptide/oligopeptide/nickel transport system permease component|tara:strand:+ start:14182 stop:15036 length:855 start_codon:yes stop_codon:yes gene_type:complete
MRLFTRLLTIIIFSLFTIFAVLYNFENESVLLKYGNNTISAFLKWCKEFLLFNWGNVNSTGQQLVLFQGDRNTIGVISFVFNSFLYGISGLVLAFTMSTYLTYKSVFDNSTTAKIVSGFFNYLSGIHIILFCFIIKIVFGHEEGFHIFILMAIAIGSYTYSDICQYQIGQFKKLLVADFIIAARAWGDSVFKHARRTIAIGLLSQWNSLIGIVFASTIIVEYFFKVHGVGYAIHRYLIKPNLEIDYLPVESEFFMIISALVIITVITMSSIKDILHMTLSKNTH